MSYSSGGYEYWHRRPMSNANYRYEFQEILPITTAIELSQSAPIDFRIITNGYEFIDLMNSYFYIQGEWVDSAGKPIEANYDSTRPASNLFHSLWTQIDVKLNGTMVSSHQNKTYPYVAYLEKTLSMARFQETRDAMFHGYYFDGFETALKADLSGLAASSFPDKDGFNRSSPFKHQKLPVGELVELLDNLHIDVFKQPRYLPNEVVMDIRFHRNVPEFYMQTLGQVQNQKLEEKDDQKASLRIKKMHFVAMKIYPTAEIYQQIQSSAERSPMRIDIRRTEMKTMVIASGTKSKRVDELFTNQLPKRIIIFFLSNAVFNGSWNRNSFIFEHYEIEEMDVVFNGRRVRPRMKLDTDSTTTWDKTPNKIDDPSKFTKLEAYHHFVSSLELTDLETQPLVAFPAFFYKEGLFTVWVYDFTPDRSASTTSIVHPVERGYISMDFKWKNALPEAINLMVYAEYDNTISIDGQRAVSTDY